MSDRSYDPNLIIQAANEKLAHNDLDGGVMLFQSALLTWSDDARENASGSLDAEQMREAIATLWMSYAHFLRKTKQFKSTTEAYEQAVEDPVAANVGRVWLDYARFAEERSKLRSAQDIYLRALVGKDGKAAAVDDEQDRSLLWQEFLIMMQKSNPTLTLQGLKEAVEQEHSATVDSKSTPEEVSADAGHGMADEGQPLSKKPRLDGTEPNSSFKQTIEESRTYVITPPDVKAEQTVLQQNIDNIDQDPDFLAIWMVRDGDSPPQPPHPPLFSPSTPKLSDPTGKDLLGEELALMLIQRLLERSGSVVLETCRALWHLTALNEKHSTLALERLDSKVKVEMQKLETWLDERLSASGAAEAAIRQMNEGERQSFRNSWNQQRQEVLKTIAWRFRKLLWMQQQMLTKLKVPGFDGTTVDGTALEFQARVCSYLHSAFYLRKTLGQDRHIKMLQSQADRLIKSGVQISKKTIGPPKSAGGFAAPHPQQPNYASMQQQQQQQQPQHHNHHQQTVQMQYGAAPPQGYGQAYVGQQMYVAPSQQNYI